jgi:hypothetical protein
MRAERLESEGKMKQAQNAERFKEMVQGNVGFCFLPKNESIAGLRDELSADKVQTAARAGIEAPSTVIVPAGPTGQDPSTTAFFQVSFGIVDELYLSATFVFLYFLRLWISQPRLTEVKLKL